MPSHFGREASGGGGEDSGEDARLQNQRQEEKWVAPAEPKAQAQAPRAAPELPGPVVLPEATFATLQRRFAAAAAAKRKSYCFLLAQPPAPRTCRVALLCDHTSSGWTSGGVSALSDCLLRRADLVLLGMASAHHGGSAQVDASDVQCLHQVAKLGALSPVLVIVWKRGHELESGMQTHELKESTSQLLSEKNGCLQPSDEPSDYISPLVHTVENVDIEVIVKGALVAESGDAVVASKQQPLLRARAADLFLGHRSMKKIVDAVLYVDWRPSRSSFDSKKSRFVPHVAMWGFVFLAASRRLLLRLLNHQHNTIINTPSPHPHQHNTMNTTPSTQHHQHNMQRQRPLVYRKP